MSVQSHARHVPPVPASAPESTRSSPKKLKKRKRERAGEAGDVEASSPKKHKSILSKFEKVSKKAQELALKREVNDEVEEAIQEQPVLRDLEPLPQPAVVPDVAFEPTFSALPQWLANPTTVASSKRAHFNTLGVDQLFVEKLGKLGYGEALAVQSALVPMLHPGPTRHPGDILVSASTGSGKTLAYLLPIVEALKKRTTPLLTAIIVVPTRKLVDQVLRQAEELCAGTRIVVSTAVGNVPLSTEQKRLVKVRSVFDPTRAKHLHAKASKHFFSGDTRDGFFRHLLAMPANHIPQYDSGADILICTPGRLIEHIETTPGFLLRSVKWLVIDEADELLDQFSHWWTRVLMDALHGETPELFRSYREILVAQMQQEGVEWALDEPTCRRREITKIILSATISKDLTKLQSLRLRSPTLISVQEESPEQHRGTLEDDIFELPSTLDEFAIPVGDGQRKPLFLLHLLLSQVSKTADEAHQSDGSDERSSPSGSTSAANSMSRVLIFTKSHENASRLSHLLSILEPQFKNIIGTMTPSLTAKASRKLLKNFASGSVKVLIASDTASRGLDIKNISQVINYDVPSSTTSYVHRVGRTARANKAGEAWTLFTKSEAAWFWNQIARSSSIRRGNKRVRRVDWKERDVTEDRRQAYETALAQLQEAVVGQASA